MAEKSWAESMYGGVDASPAPAPAAKPAAAPTPASPEGSSWAATMHKPEAPATAPGDWTATMHQAEEPTEEPGPWSGSDQEPPAADDAAPVVPESYTFDLPEGLEIDPEMNTALQGTLKELKLPQDKAAKLVDLHIKSVQAQQAQFERTVESWSNETMATLGDTAPEVFGHAKAALERFDRGGQIRELLDRSGLGSKVEFIRLFEQIGRNLAYQREAGRRRP